MKNQSLILETPVTPKAEEVELCRQGPMHHPRGMTSEIEGSKAATPAPTTLKQWSRVIDGRTESIRRAPACPQTPGQPLLALGDRLTSLYLTLLTCKIWSRAGQIT